MPTSAILRSQIEAALSERIPSALTPLPREIRPAEATNIHEIDELLQGGLPVGAISEIVGPESSGRTSLALAFVAGVTQAEKVCAWIDVSNTWHPESAAALGVDLSRLLWVRCGVPSSSEAPRRPSLPTVTIPEKCTTPPVPKKGLYGGGFGPHPRTEARGLSGAVSDLLRDTIIAPQPTIAPQPKPHPRKEGPQKEGLSERPAFFPVNGGRPVAAKKPWSRLEQALRVTDLLLEGGGFSSIVLDMGGIEPEYALRVPPATWFRFRGAAERAQMNLLLLTQAACAKNSAGVVLRLDYGNALTEESTVFTGMVHQVEVVRRRFIPPPAQVVALRKPPQSVQAAHWQSRTAWTGRK